jgi:hypothetical protein
MLAAKAGNVSVADFTFMFDATPPTVVCPASPSILDDRGHDLVPVSIGVGVSDQLSGASGFSLVRLFSSQGRESGDMVGWTLGAPDTDGFLRISRSGRGNTRRYELTYEGRERAGNAGACVAVVNVPHDRR